MFFEYQITIPANTESTSMQNTKIKIPYGILRWASIQFPSGCHGLAKIKVLLGSTTLWPRNTNGHISGDDAIIAIEEYQKIKSGSNVLDIYTWNEDVTYAHTLTLRFTILPEDIVNPYSSFESIKNSLTLLLRRIGIR